MALTGTTTIRVPVTLRDTIARLADGRGASMVDLVTEAVERLERDEWWDSVHASLAALSDDDADASAEETEGLDGAAADGL